MVIERIKGFLLSFGYPLLIKIVLFCHNSPLIKCLLDDHRLVTVVVAGFV